MIRIKEWIKKNFTSEEFEKASDEEKKIILKNRDNVLKVSLFSVYTISIFTVLKLVSDNAYKSGFINGFCAVGKMIEEAVKVENNK